MKRYVFIALLSLCFAVGKAQSRQTSWQEYNYLVQGRFDLVLPDHQLRKSNISAEISFADGARKVVIFELYRTYSNTPCAILIQYQHDGSLTNICVPDINSGDEMWTAYDKKLATLNDTGSALETVSYALGRYAASH